MNLIYDIGLDVHNDSIADLRRGGTLPNLLYWHESLAKT